MKKGYYSIGDEVLYKGEKYILALIYIDEDKVLLIKADDNTIEHKVPVTILQPYSKKHADVHARMRTNEALEEDLTLANDKIALLEHVIKEGVRLLENSEHPFYHGLKILKENNNG